MPKNLEHSCSFLFKVTETFVNARGHKLEGSEWHSEQINVSKRINPMAIWNTLTHVMVSVTSQLLKKS